MTNRYIATSFLLIPFDPLWGPVVKTNLIELLAMQNEKFEPLKIPIIKSFDLNYLNFYSDTKVFVNL